ncbi:O-antigen polymerase [Solibacillus silvestris]
MLNFYTVALLLFISIAFILFNSSDFLLQSILIVNTFIICIGFYLSIQKRIINIDLIYWIFNYLFFVVAVVVQSNEMYFPTTLPVNVDKIIIGQLLIFLWNFIFIVSRNRTFNLLQSNNTLIISKNVTNLYFILSTIFFIFIFLNNGIQYFFGDGSIVSNTVSQPIQLLVHATVYGIVFSNFIFLYSRRKNGKLLTYLLIGISLVELIYIISPFNTNRYNLGFVIIFFLWYFYRKSISAYKFSFILFFGMLFLFPLLDIFRFGFNSDFNFSIKSSLDQFQQLHFDAFSNFLASIEYSGEYSLLLGANLLGTLLFFVPSSLWQGKPEGSGTRIGNYLIDHYDLNFNNLSNPLVSEFYLAFGVVGIILGAFLVATMINKIEQNSKNGLENEMLYGIILSYLFILLRGSLIVAFSSIAGSIFFMIVLPRILKRKKDIAEFNKINIDGE